MIKRHQVQGKHFNLTRYLKYEKYWGLKSFIIRMYAANSLKTVYFLTRL